MLIRILGRLRPLVHPLAIALWGGFLWAWSVLAEVHLAEFVYRIGGDVSYVVHAHPWSVLVGTVALLLMAAIWPEIKHLIPKLPKTIHDRVAELSEAFEVQKQINETTETNYGTLSGYFGGRLNKLEEDGVKTIKERSDLGLRISSGMKLAQDVPSRSMR